MAKQVIHDYYISNQNVSVAMNGVKKTMQIVDNEVTKIMDLIIQEQQKEKPKDQQQGVSVCNCVDEFAIADVIVSIGSIIDLVDD
ncbi:MAG: hypothetical protein EZS28_036960 [Streblomastix strix]|uniref:Uncharacterized protein n=1 Tax=Streblomastix strix TaxID=222440 RepID=A0A5J4UBF3_9EUKA|nr:MAG: hypothetical protein EZS28_036960 [Streblomastix strix]